MAIHAVRWCFTSKWRLPLAYLILLYAKCNIWVSVCVMDFSHASTSMCAGTHDVIKLFLEKYEISFRQYNLWSETFKSTIEIIVVVDIVIVAEHPPGLAYARLASLFEFRLWQIVSVSFEHTLMRERGNEWIKIECSVQFTVVTHTHTHTTRGTRYIMYILYISRWR